MRQLIISCSLSPGSRSAMLAGQLCDVVAGSGDEIDLIDLRDLQLPFCDADKCYAHPNVKTLRSAIQAASAITIATPIYNFETGGATRNMIAVTGDAWTEKIVGLVCAAGGQGSYMSVMSLANSLMLDFRCMIVPRFVYASAESFADGKLADPKIQERIELLGRELQRVAQALA